MAWLVWLLLLAVAAGLPVMVYNRLVQAQNRYRNAFAQIGVQLKRRHDLIPNLLAAVKGYLKHESETLEQVAQARNQAAASLPAADPASPAALQQLAAAENRLSGALRGLQVQIEAYPELKAAETMQQFAEEMASTENRITFARQAYNDAVMEYNTLRQVFPNNLLAAAFGHRQDAPLLEFDDAAALGQAPQVRF
ncbi:LemA family protein [Neisseria shayeganii]|uniref:LemA family protein n=1 Tax=Neisseria shayeganii 871 TaxID=1032488 RepID=G4CGL2_9NEIS|nr:LemA family protein [Neisseria shayeganii]EGY52965.1 LemA family protein [Neisseria shayeganii 871]